MSLKSKLRENTTDYNKLNCPLIISKTVDDVFNEFSKLQLDLITIERQMLTKLHVDGKVSDEIWRKIERELELKKTGLIWKYMKAKLEVRQ